jgi:YVTN family beta-propeller protein
MARSLRALVLFGLLASPVAAQVVTNAPVAPDTIYVGRLGTNGGLSIIDLNGFGGGTGDPTFDPTGQTFQPGWSMYPFNPNVKLQGAQMIPPLQPGTSTIDGGSAGVFTLTRNSALDDRLLRAPGVLSISDMMLGQPLDLLLNASPPQGPCISGANQCAIASLRILNVALGIGLNTLVPVPPGTPGTVYNYTSLGNPISWAPSPNPPPRVNPPTCISPLIAGQEPTSVDTTLTNLLGPGDALGDPANGIPPSGLLTSSQNGYFNGPSRSATACQPFGVRQQIGHFLYIADRVAGQIVVVNSNTLRILQRITMTDATELAMSGALNLLGVTQPSLNQVSFVDIDPASLTFHQVVHVTPVEHAPRGIAWTPDDEDILVCNEGSNSVSIIAMATLAVRKTVRRGLDQPFAIAITPRETNFGFERYVYLAWILDRSGHVSLFESGPSGVNGWGFDEIIWRTPYVFQHPQAIQPDPLSLKPSVWVAHEVRLDANGQPTSQLGGAVSNLAVDSALPGPLPLAPGELPNLRFRTLRIEASIGDDQLTGKPTDIAFDDQRNLGILPVVPEPFSVDALIPINGKHPVRQVNGQAFNTNEATYLFVPVQGAQPGQEHIDVIRIINGQRIDTNPYLPGLQSIPVPGASVVANYFRQ